MDAIKYLENRANKSLNESDPNHLGIPLFEALEFWPYQVILIIIYSTTAFVSLTSNLITIVVLLKGDRISSELWKYLINLSVSDIVLSLLSIPFTYTSFMLNQWIFPTQLCPVVNFAQTCSVFVSVWTLAVIGIDRYNAVIHPLRETSETMEWLRNNKWFILTILWLSGISIGSAQLIYSRAIPFQYANETLYDCREIWDDYWGKIYTIVIFVATFALPLTILVFVYSSIGFHVWRHVIPGNSDKQRDDIQRNRKDKVVRILAMIVLLFAICWLPIHVFSLLVWFYPKILSIQTEVGYRTFICTYFVCHFMSMGHSFVNPIIYCFMSSNFRVNLYSVLNKYVSQLRCRRSEYLNEESDSHTRSQFVSINSTKFMKRTIKSDDNNTSV